MKALDRKLKRDLFTLKYQAITIGLVVLSGVSIMIASSSAYDSLIAARDIFYTKSRLAEGFASLNRAPESHKAKLRSIDGISYLETRIVKEAVLDFPEKKLPTAGRFVSLTKDINKLSIQSGRLPVGENEVIISESFADANKLKVEDRIIASIGGKRKVLTITGTALSPEYVYVFRSPNPMPDDEHYGVLWMERDGLEAAFGMEGAFNDVVFLFSPGAFHSSVLKRVDTELERYGGYGSYDREKLPSHSFLRDEFKQLRSMAYIIPFVFLGIAAFLLHIVTTRIVSKDREQIATLKALGYSNSTIRWHYLTLISIITVISSFLGLVVGYYLGEAMTDLYGAFYRFPNLNFLFLPYLNLQGILIGFLSGGVGAIFAIKQVTRLQPAQAMRPPTPARYHTVFLEKIFDSIPTQGRMILRNLFQRPVRTFLSILGISSSVMILILGLFSQDTIDYMLQMQFDIIQREDVLVSFLAPVPFNASYELGQMKGVNRVEGYRMVPIRIKKGNYTKELVLQGIPTGSELRRLIGKNEEVLIPPISGIYLNSAVSEKLQIHPGDIILMEVLEGNRKTLSVTVEKTVEEMLGQGAYMNRESVNRILGEGDSLNMIALSTDKGKEEDLLKELKNYPKISGISTREGILKSYKDIMERSMQATRMVLLIFASVIAIGVVYNTAMIALSERSFVLGSLRILGFTRVEVFQILAGELSILTLLALPVGAVLGYVTIWLMMNSVDTEGLHFTIKITTQTYGKAMVTIVLTAFLSFFILYRRIRSMDLLSILKVRE